ncbi:MAG: hypothetical protein A2798_00795 [Candidatus Levybacteria bacterium RIFCSPHIGHO2_01_FULL_37_17]|nr:MAG: hypothetical protein A2798_00795 [Candidatus Levybacteria bacterium RIFCSPHIGHO2_01_FULL_37_17]OGH36989.1 MAG: hypothetical protein A2959_01655 [Candidatus Levybacteria bacterium RIFCSPLOWO2_01_FULL_38_23]
MGEENKEADLEQRAIYTTSKGDRVSLNPDVPMNHKWFKGEFHFGPWGGDSSQFKGDSKDRVRVSMIGERLSPTVRNGIASATGVITAVIDPEDRDLIGQTGWWKLQDLSKKTKIRRAA